MDTQQTTTNEQYQTLGELMREDDDKATRGIVQGAAALLIGIGLLFTGYLNFMLYSRAFSDEMKIMGLIPAVLIEGSLAVFLIGNFVWFSAGTQGKMAKIFGWAMFGIVAMNCVVEFNAQTNPDAMGGFIDIYATWGVPIMIPLVIGFWKVVLDSDPRIEAKRERRKVVQMHEKAKHQALLSALSSDDYRNALQEYARNAADTINSDLRGVRPILLEAPVARGGPTMEATGTDVKPVESAETNDERLKSLMAELEDFLAEKKSGQK